MTESFQDGFLACFYPLNISSYFSDYTEVIPVKSIVGDIRKLAEVSRALHGADCVLHIAGIISIGTFPDVSAMQAINVEGKFISWLLHPRQRRV